MKIKISASNFTFYTIVGAGILISFLAYNIFPERFFYDSNIIINNPRNYFKGIIGSYSFSIWFYKITRLKYLPFEIIGVIQYSIMTYIFYKIGIPKKLHIVTLKNIIIYLMFLMLAIYVSVPSKEFINFIYLSIIVFLVKKRTKNFTTTTIFSVALLLFLGGLFRPYYIIVAIVAIFIYLLSYIKIKNYKIATISYGLVILICISLSYGLVKGEFISNSTRGHMLLHANIANSAIIPPLETDTWYGESISIIYGFFSVNLPVNALKHILSPQILLFIIWQLLLFFILIREYDKSIKEGKRQNYELWLFYILFAYFIVQGIFEPDLGSALRHKASVFPIIYYLLNYDEFRKKI